MEILWGHFVLSLFYLVTSRQLLGISSATVDNTNNNKYNGHILQRSVGINIYRHFYQHHQGNGDNYVAASGSERKRSIEKNSAPPVASRGSSAGDTRNIVLKQDSAWVNTGWLNNKKDATALNYQQQSRSSSSSSSIDGDTPQGLALDLSHDKTSVHNNREDELGLVGNSGSNARFGQSRSNHLRRKRDTKRAQERLKNAAADWAQELPLLMANDTDLAVLQYIEQLSQVNARGTQGERTCQLAKQASASSTRGTASTVTTGSNGPPNVVNNIASLLHASVPHSYYNSIFGPHIQAAVRTSNLLSNIFKTWELPNGTTLYNEYFYYSLARSLVESNVTVAGSTIAFDWKNFRSTAGVDYFCPHVYRQGRAPASPASSSRERLAFINLGVKSTGFELCSNQSWFKEMRLRDYPFLWDFNHNTNICKKYKDRASTEDVHTPVVRSQEGRWFGPQLSCQPGSNSFPRQWTVSYSIPFYGCTMNDSYLFKGVVNTKLDLGRVDVDQCSIDESRPFANSHRCRRDTTQCEHVPGFGFRRGGYKCVCKTGFYFKTTASTNSEDYFNGSVVEVEYLRYVLNKSKTYTEEFSCLPCDESCQDCTNSSRCFVEYNILMRGVPLGVTSFCMTIVLVIAYSLVRLRKSKVMKASFWLLLEIFIVGALLLYSTIIFQYFEPTEIGCLVIPWFREVGFAIVYGALVLKIYRVLAEFQSRKAHRVHVRDKDLLKWLLCIVCVVIGYMSAWTALNLDHIKDGSSMLDNGTTPEQLQYKICKSSWWDILIEIGEFIFLGFGIYLCYCIRAAPSDYLETRYISWAIYNETFISAILHIARHILWSITNPDYLFLMYFIRCQLTVTVNVALVLAPKIYYSHHPPEDESYRNRAYSTSDVQDNVLPESVKLHVGINSNGDVDVGEVNLSDMDPEDIRTELKRLYTQLQIYKTKTMRKDNPHISKRRGGRKHTHRRFSLQAFHHKHRHHHSHHPSASEVSMDHDTEMSRTPEESTNSNEGCGYSMEESTCSVQEVRTPTVTFKPGHKTMY